MANDSMRYDLMVQGALLSVVREALRRTARDGLPGEHHFYIAFRTRHPGVEMPEDLRTRYPEEMTIVLQHQFWDLEVRDDHFTVSLSFNREPHKLKIPFAAIKAFYDPSVEFGLQFQAQGEEATTPHREANEASEATAPAASEPTEAGAKSGEVVQLDTFRKK